MYTNDNNAFGIGMLMMMCILACPCPSVPTRIITTLLFQAYTINWVILLIVLLIISHWYPM